MAGNPSKRAAVTLFVAVPFLLVAASSAAEEIYADILQCVEARQIEVVSIRGVSTAGQNVGEAIVVVLHSRASYDIRTVVVRGQILESLDGSVQDMVVASDCAVFLSAGEREEFLLDVLCIELQKDPPTREHTYEFGDKAQEPLRGILATADENDYRPYAAQLATWAYTDNATEETLLAKPEGVLMAVAEPDDFFGSIAQAQEILDRADTDLEFDKPGVGRNNFHEFVLANLLTTHTPLLAGLGVGLLLYLILVISLHAKSNKSTGLAYLLWFFFGGLGFHKFYLRKTFIGILYTFTGGFFLLGLLIDLFTIPGQVRRFNERLQQH